MSTEHTSIDISEPDLDRARQTANLAHGVVIKLKVMGLPEDLDAELASISTDLSDLWSAQIDLTARLEAFLESSDDWSSVGDQLVDIRADIDHVAWHLNSVRRPLTKVTQYAYRQSLNGNEASGN